MTETKRTSREKVAYEAGQAAWRNGTPFDDNPHAGGKTLSGFNQERYQWFLRWLDAEHRSRGWL